MRRYEERYDAETSADIPWRRLRGDEELALAAGLESRKSEKVPPRALKHPDLAMADHAPQKFLSGAAILTIAPSSAGITTLPDVTGDAGIALYLALIATSVLMAAFVSRRMVYDEWSSLDQSCRNPPAQEDEEDAADTDLEEIESLIKNGDGEEPSPGDFVNQPDLSKTCIVGLTREACGQKTSVYVAIAMVASALCLALAQMMVCAAILDSMMITLAGKTCALG
ncbi:hypothetical protein THAOC_26554, partial [Thalassiosira oceanica]